MNNLEDNILDIANNNYEYLMNLQNVNGIGLGYKHINGVNTFEPCIHVLVENKINTKYIIQNNLIPKSYMGIKTDVINRGIVTTKKSKNIFGTKARPLEAGYSISPMVKYDARGSGTIACIVKKISKNKIRYFILSNNHVLSDDNKVPIGSYIIQPSDEDNGSIIYDKVAILSKYVPSKKKILPNWPINYMDCAIAELTDKYRASNKIATLGSFKGVNKATLGLKVKKVGMVTGVTEGEVITIGVTSEVDGAYGKYIYKNQIDAKLDNKHGDSGAIVVNDNNEAVGLFFAGSDTVGTFTDIGEVLKKLKVELFLDETII